MKHKGQLHDNNIASVRLLLRPFLSQYIKARGLAGRQIKLEA